jgi:transforming growth factor-beta-induced protein
MTQRLGLRISLSSLLLLSACDSGTTTPSTADGGTSPDGATRADSGADAATLPTIAAIAAGNPDFSILVAAATKANLVETLSGQGTFTVFAPTNAAFAASGINQAALDALSAEQVAGILTYHALATRVASTELTAGPVTTLSTFPIFITTEGGAKINGGNAVAGGANVVDADIAASNGIVHVIDRVLLPPTVADLARYAQLTTLAGALEAQGLVDDLQAAGPFTVFAPTNAAFAALPAIPEGDALTSALLYHVHAGSQGSASLPLNISTLAENQYGDNLSILFAGEMLNGSTSVAIADLQATNGIVHVVDKVLLPMNIPEAATAAGLTGLLGAVTAAAPLPGGTTVAAALSTQAPYTVFAPSNAAFTAVQSVIATLTPAQIRDVLLYHVLDTTAFPSPVLAAELPATQTELRSLGGGNITLVPTTTPKTVEGAAIEATDIVVTNGVIHVIGAVMIPPPPG